MKACKRAGAQKEILAARRTPRGWVAADALPGHDILGSGGLAAAGFLQRRDH